jgi:hypothetical protein
LSLGESTGINILIVNKGEVKIKKENWKAFQKASTGSLLRPNDYLQMGSNASAFLLCSNTERWQPTAGKQFRVSEGCPRGTASRPPNVARAQTRTGNEPIPYIISPRHTLLLNNKPIILRWNPVVGASSYTVMIKSPSESIWETEVSSNQVVYEAYTSLKPGVRYIAIVHADINVSSLDEESPFSQQDGLGMGFSILDELTQQEITTKTEQLTQKLSGEAKTLALVEFYQKNKLNYEAIDQLESLIKENHKNAAIYHKLGEIYQQIQLPLLARDNYLKAVELIPDEDIAGIAEVQADLGQIYRTLGQKKEAVYWLTLAYNQYQQLGEQQRQTEIKQLVEQISQSAL